MPRAAAGSLSKHAGSRRVSTNAMLDVSPRHFRDIKLFMGVRPPESAAIFSFSMHKIAKKPLSQEQRLERIYAVNIS